MDLFLVLDFGSQYSQLIVRRLRDLGYYTELHPYHLPLSTLQKLSPKGIILSGGPFSLGEKGATQRDVKELHALAPLLGICYGMQMIAHQKGAKLVKGVHREYGLQSIYWEKPYLSCLKELKETKELKGTKENREGRKEQKVWMSHGDTIEKLPSELRLCARSKEGYCAAFSGERLLAFQFHPEVTHTDRGGELLNYFTQHICGSSPRWCRESIFERAKSQLSQQIDISGKKKILCALSGGVDSSVLAIFLNKILGPERLCCFFMDTGLLREGEFTEVMKAYKQLGLKVQGIDGSATFLEAIKGVVEPEEKRKVIGRVFIEVFKRESKKWNSEIAYFAQGTLYPDVIESGSSSTLSTPSKTTIKSHHNVGGLPSKIPWKLVEPFRKLFKDEVRQLGEHMSVSKHILYRHPFPGPGLAVRILGEVTPEKIRILRKCDALFMKALKAYNVYSEIWQALCVLLPIKSVGVQGDGSSYAYVLALRCVVSTDGMTAHWYAFKSELLEKISTIITNEVHEINRVVYDITHKPPGTIEWE